MKFIITETQLKRLIKRDVEELNVTQKELVGKGAHHRVFPSKHNPDVVYKMTHPGDVDMWYDLFNENPNIFPKVYGKKTTIVPIKYFNGEIKYDEVEYAVVEKLDTKSFLKVWDEIDNFCIQNPFQYYVRYFEKNMDYIVNLGKRIHKINNQLFEKYLELVNLIDELYELRPSADLHKDQFGYDKNGRLKCLDI